MRLKILLTLLLAAITSASAEMSNKTFTLNASDIKQQNGFYKPPHTSTVHMDLTNKSNSKYLANSNQTRFRHSPNDGNKSLKTSKGQKTGQKTYKIKAVITDMEDPWFYDYSFSMALSNGEEKIFGSEGVDSAEQIMEVPSGEINIIWIISDYLSNLYILKKTGVIVEDDMKIEFSLASATEEIKWHPVLPNGEEPALDLIEYNYDDSEEEYLIKEGNVYDISNFLIIQAPDISTGTFDFSANEVHSYYQGNVFYRGLLNVRTQPGVQLSLSRGSMYFFRDGACGVMLVADGCHSQSVSNNADDYFIVKQTFAPSKYISDIDLGNGEVKRFDVEKGMDVGIYTSIDGKLSGYDGFSCELKNFDNKNLYFCQSSGKDIVYAMPSLNHMLGNGFGMKDESVTCLPYDWAGVVSGLPEYLQFNNFNWWTAFDHLPYQQNSFLKHMSNPYLSCNIDEDILWDYGCPTMTFFTIPLDWGTIFQFQPIGRLNERRNPDLYDTYASVAVNGKAPTAEQLENIQHGMLPENSEIYFEFRNENVLVDDMEGYNLMKTGFITNTEDPVPPTIQVCRTVNVDGNITDRFESPAEGIIEFYAGDFEYKSEPGTFNEWFDETAPSEVIVEYAPTGSDVYAPLEVENEEEHYFTPGFGHLYRASTASVTTESETGWYDLRITLHDEAGNYQEQTLSPAFYIGPTTSVSSISHDINVRVEGNNILAPEHAKIYGVNGILTDGRNLESGLYLVRHGSKCVKVMVK